MEVSENTASSLGKAFGSTLSNSGISRPLREFMVPNVDSPKLDSIFKTTGTIPPHPQRKAVTHFRGEEECPTPSRAAKVTPRARNEGDLMGRAPIR